MKKIIITVLLLLSVLIVVSRFRSCEIKREAGWIAPEEPIQNNLLSQEVIEFKGFTIFKQAEFEVTARVLSKEHYLIGKDAKLSPYDLALGWGPMSDTNVIKRLSISQGGRFYYWQTKDGFPIPRKDIERNSANMHLIPSAGYLKDKIASVKKGNVIHFRGYLVKVTAEKGWHWNSSMSRDDIGNGACEVVFVEEFEIIM